MANDWIKVFTTTNPIEAEIVLSLLHENGIDAVEMNKRDSSYQSFGYIEILCPKDRLIEALHIVNSK